MNRKNELKEIIDGLLSGTYHAVAGTGSIRNIESSVDHVLAERRGEKSSESDRRLDDPDDRAIVNEIVSDLVLDRKLVFDLTQAPGTVRPHSGLTARVYH